MLDLPTEYSLEDFYECGKFAKTFFRLHDAATRNYLNGVEEEKDAELVREAEDEAVWFYYNLIARHEKHLQCVTSFSPIIRDCYSNSSYSVELPFSFRTDGHDWDCLNVKPNRNIIAQTAHDVAFQYLSIFSTRLMLPCGESDNGSLTEDKIRENLNEIIHESMYFEKGFDETQAIIDRIAREYLMVAVKYPDSRLKRVSEAQIRSIIVTERLASGQTTEEIRESVHLMVSFWPNPLITRYQGWPFTKYYYSFDQFDNLPDEWDFTSLKPSLKQEFPDIDWDKY